jgi:hypothetical protein
MNRVKVQEQTKTALQIKLKEQTKLADDTKNETSTKTQPKPSPKPNYPKPSPLSGTGEGIPEKDKNKKPLPLDGKAKEDKIYTPTSEELKNATAIKAGAFWWVRLPNGKLKVYRDKDLPSEITDVRDGKGSGFKSVQTVQGKPINTSIQIGFTTANIKKPSRTPGAKGAVNYTVHRPGMKTTRKGKVIHIIGVGDTRKLPKGRIMV